MLYINTFDSNNNQLNDCININLEENYFLKNSIIIQLYFKEKLSKIKKEELYYIDNSFVVFLINIFILKLIKFRELKNFNFLINKLNFTLEEVNSLVIFLNSEIKAIDSNLSYKSEFFYKLNLTINSLFFLIFINNQSEIKDYLELNIYSTFSIKNLNFFLKNITKEYCFEKKENYKAWYIILYIKKISNSLNITIIDSFYCNIFFQFFLKNKLLIEIKEILNMYLININFLINSNQKYLRKIKSNKEINEDLNTIKNDKETYFLKNKSINDTINIDPQKIKTFVINFLSKKYNIFLKNKCSQQLSFLNDISFFLIEINLFYESKFIVEFGVKYWSNSSLNLSYLKKKLYDKILLNTKILNLETDFKNNYLKNLFFKDDKFYIKKNIYNENSSIFDFEKIKIINNKLKKLVYYTDINIFLELFNFFENIFKNIILKKNIKKLKECINYFEDNIQKINNFNFFNIESLLHKEKEKYELFFNILNLYSWSYNEYIHNIILNTNFLNFFYKKDDIKELKLCIEKEKENLNYLLNNLNSFDNLNFLIKTIKNIFLFLNNTLEINIKDVSNNNYNSKYFIEIEYREYIIFINKFKIIVAYLEQIITISNLKQKIIENNFNQKKLFGIEIKLDFRGRLYSINIIKAYDNNKLLRQSIKIKNNIKIKELLSWYIDLFKKLKISISYFLKKDIYEFILDKKEFKHFNYLFKLNLTEMTKKNFLDLLYLKTYVATICYLGFLLLKSEEKKTYTLLNILKKGYDFYYNDNNKEIINEIKKSFLNLTLELNLEEYLELTQTLNSLDNLNKNISFNSLLLNNKLLSLDSSCNGYTHLLYTFSELTISKFKEFKKILNLSSDNNNYDFYSEVLNEIKNNNFFLKKQIEDKIINRNSIKKIVMTIPYNAKEYSFHEKLKNEIIEKDDKKKKIIIKELIEFFSKNFKNKIINKSFILNLKTFLKKNKIKNIWYVIDENTKINITYYKEKNEKILFIDNILNKKKSVYIKTLTNEINIEKTVIASIANIIHANDAFIIKELIINCKLNILTIHDCVKFDAFLFEEIIFLYEYTFKNFYKNYNIYNKIYYETNDSSELKKVFDDSFIKKIEDNCIFEKSNYILKF